MSQPVPRQHAGWAAAEPGGEGSSQARLRDLSPDHGTATRSTPWSVRDPPVPVCLDPFGRNFQSTRCRTGEQLSEITLKA
ncbi:hypothetical protein TNCT6_02060 [Streptomyces sp. 6-11-2]|nr:hypothetical protein TNCT6_02060 [Streptomyces sp. 6-11-2]